MIIQVLLVNPSLALPQLFGHIMWPVMFTFLRLIPPPPLPGKIYLWTHSDRPATPVDVSGCPNISERVAERSTVSTKHEEAETNNRVERRLSVTQVGNR